MDETENVKGADDAEEMDEETEEDADPTEEDLTKTDEEDEEAV